MLRAVCCFLGEDTFAACLATPTSTGRYSNSEPLLWTALPAYQHGLRDDVGTISYRERSEVAQARVQLEGNILVYPHQNMKLFLLLASRWLPSCQCDGFPQECILSFCLQQERFTERRAGSITWLAVDIMAAVNAASMTDPRWWQLLVIFFLIQWQVFTLVVHFCLSQVPKKQMPLSNAANCWDFLGL